MVYGKMNNEEIVYNKMREIGKPVKPADLSKELELNKEEVLEAIKNLKNKGLVHSPRRCYYQAN